MSAMLCLGSSDEYGSWKTICIDLALPSERGSAEAK